MCRTKYYQCRICVSFWTAMFRHRVNGWSQQRGFSFYLFQRLVRSPSLFDLFEVESGVWSIQVNTSVLLFQFYKNNDINKMYKLHLKCSCSMNMGFQWATILCVYCVKISIEFRMLQPTQTGKSMCVEPTADLDLMPIYLILQTLFLLLFISPMRFFFLEDSLYLQVAQEKFEEIKIRNQQREPRGSLTKAEINDCRPCKYI